MTTFGKQIQGVTWRLIATESLQDAENHIKKIWKNKIVSKTALFSEVVTDIDQKEIEKLFDETADKFGVFRSNDSRIKLVERAETAEKRIKYLEDDLERSRKLIEKRTDQLIESYQLTLLKS